MTKNQTVVNNEEEKRKKVEEVRKKIMDILEENNMDLQIAIQHVPVVNLVFKEKK
jgi:hypothetical protein